MNDLVLCVGSSEFATSRTSLVKRSAYLAQVLAQANEYAEVKVNLPHWVTSLAVQIYLESIDNGQLSAMDMHTCQQVLWFADFLQDSKLVHSLIEEAIVPNLTKETVLMFLQDAFNKQKAADLTDSWQLLLAKAIACVTQHMSFILSKYSHALNSMHSDTLQQLFELSLKHSFPKTPDPLVLEEYRRVNHLKSLSEGLTVAAQPPKEVRCEWRIDSDETGNFYKESDVFWIENSAWKLCVWCFAHDGRLEVSLKNSLSPTNLEKHSVALVDCSLTINGEESTHELLFNWNTETQVLLKKVSYNRNVFSFTLKANINYAKSSIIKCLVSDPCKHSLHKLPYKILHFVLSYKYLNVPSEDEAFRILAEWVEHNQSNTEDMAKLFDCLRWNYLSLKCLVLSGSKYRSLVGVSNYSHYLLEALGAKMKSKRASLLRSSSLLNEHPVEVGPRHSYKKSLKTEEYPSLMAYSHALFDILLEEEDEAECVEVRHLKKKKAELEARLAEQKLSQVENHSLDQHSSIHSRGSGCHSSGSGWNQTLENLKRPSNARRLCGDLVGKVKSRAHNISRGQSPNSSVSSRFF